MGRPFVDEFHVPRVGRLVPDEGAKGPVDGLPEEEGLFVIPVGNGGNGGMGRREPEPADEAFGRGQEIAGPGPAMPHRGDEVQRQAPGVEPEPAVSG